MAITTVLIALLMLGIGIGLGVAIGRSMYSTEDHSEALQQEMDQLKKEYDDYRNSVNQHFATTSDLVNELTDSYRKVYQHLATGAQTLCLPAGKTPDLELPQTPLYEAESDTRDTDTGETEAQPQEPAAEDSTETRGDDTAESTPADAQASTENNEAPQPAEETSQASETAQAAEASSQDDTRAQATEETSPDTASTGETTADESTGKPKSEAA